MQNKTRTLTIDGMSCQHCVRAVEDALGQLEGVAVEHVEIGRARVAYDPDKVRPEAIDQAVEHEGYTVSGHA